MWWIILQCQVAKYISKLEYDGLQFTSFRHIFQIKRKLFFSDSVVFWKICNYIFNLVKIYSNTDESYTALDVKMNFSIETQFRVKFSNWGIETIKSLDGLLFDNFRPSIHVGPWIFENKIVIIC